VACTYFFTFFFKIQKTWLFTYFCCCTRFLEHWLWTTQNGWFYNFYTSVMLRVAWTTPAYRWQRTLMSFTQTNTRLICYDFNVRLLLREMLDKQINPGVRLAVSMIKVIAVEMFTWTSLTCPFMRHHFFEKGRHRFCTGVIRATRSITTSRVIRATCNITLV